MLTDEKTFAQKVLDYFQGQGYEPLEKNRYGEIRFELWRIERGEDVPAACVQLTFNTLGTNTVLARIEAKKHPRTQETEPMFPHAPNIAQISFSTSGDVDSINLFSDETLCVGDQGFHETVAALNLE